MSNTWRERSCGVRLGSARRNRAGFTILEVLISSVIMVFVLVSTMKVISHSSLYLADLRMRSRGSQILQQRVEELRAMTWDSVTNTPATFTNEADTNKIFRGFVNISSYNSYSGATTVVRATVTVTWTNRHGLMVTNTLTTLIGNQGLNKTSL